MQNEPIEVTLKVTSILEKLGIPYLIGGSLASTLYGMVCTTQNSDIITEMRPEHIPPFIAALESEFYIDDEMIVESIQRNSSFNIIHIDVPDPIVKNPDQSFLRMIQREIMVQS